MIPLLLTCTIFVSALATATVLFLRKLTRPFIEVKKLVRSLNRIGISAKKASLAFEAFSASVDGLENPALKHLEKMQP